MDAIVVLVASNVPPYVCVNIPLPALLTDRVPIPNGVDKPADGGAVARGVGGIDPLLALPVDEIVRCNDAGGFTDGERVDERPALAVFDKDVALGVPGSVDVLDGTDVAVVVVIALTPAPLPLPLTGGLLDFDDIADAAVDDGTEVVVGLVADCEVVAVVVCVVPDPFLPLDGGLALLPNELSLSPMSLSVSITDALPADVAGILTPDVAGVVDPGVDVDAAFTLLCG
jgi:hypothetical protein